ncbi:MAG: hypothetical protein UX09_C0006G0021 [Candidatus Uhrbacteria bacterium GW2011_GWE2_45_35]|uniref:Uncharacterized protein n=2 Tax=Candidatus Uhriibacteriota TaxID=1752732 RepID=A0A0G1MHS0_9BACT|nr:MAG: hypothetical protein UW63_C0014G0011 [Candidatus Uhrbacteria bacterium GW2011_GWF2_44_350]KKU09025.1 MAG: hypothetical protein UX09_C0006G0021 [Candidatus Uhrbacteria bacterium GW2011_GWE2_45_35]HBR81147.1 hypothetical protein [Candidatus Uhrbacteria bacterium]HCU31617.1 hypothetical protein [Candidatus Uhrbacteria bacterium]
MLIIPKTPKFLGLSVGRLWNGKCSPDSRLLAFVEIQQTDEGILIRSTTPPLPGYKNPEVLPGTRLENIDAFEKICVFFVEESGQYLEVKLGIGGQYLVLGFDKPLEEVANFSDSNFKTSHQVFKDGRTVNDLVIPFELFPTNLRALNAFFTVGNQILAYHPLVGPEPNLHQPESFPFAKLEE